MADKRVKPADPKAVDPLAKADALIGRHRSKGKGPATFPPTQPMLDLELPDDIPVLTEVVAAPQPAAPAELDIAALEEKIRAQLLDSLGAELERAIDARVSERIGTRIAEIMQLAARELEAEIRTAARAAAAEAIAAELARLKPGPAPDK